MLKDKTGGSYEEKRKRMEKSSRAHAGTYHVHQQHRSTTAGGSIGKGSQSDRFQDQRQDWQQSNLICRRICQIHDRLYVAERAVHSDTGK